LGIDSLQLTVDNCKLAVQNKQVFYALFSLSKIF